MGRIARNDILYDGCCAHVFSRSFEKRKIFETEDDFIHFKDLLLKTKRKYNYKIHHYCIMHTHFHMVVTMDSVKHFSVALQILKKSYSERYNFHHKRFGPLWRERFKSLLIENERYLYACGLYVEHNSVEVGLVDKSEDWKHSSAPFTQLGKQDKLISPTPKVNLPKDFDIKEKNEYTKGMGIGSALFKLQLRESVFP